MMKTLHRILGLCNTPTNMNTLDRSIRITLGLLLIAISPVGFGLLDSGIIGWFFALFGLANVISAVMGWCFMYSLVGLSSLSSQDDHDNIELDFPTLRKKAILGFGIVSVLISAFFISEGYQSSKETIQAMELNQLHTKAVSVFDAIEGSLLNNSPFTPDRPLNTSRLLDQYFLGDAPVFIALARSDETWQFASNNMSDDLKPLIIDSLSHDNDQFHSHILSTQRHEHESLHALNNLENYYVTVDDQAYAIIHHEVALAQTPHHFNIYIGELSHTAPVLNRILTRMVISSTVVVWIALWGAIAVAFFIWRYIEGSNRRAIHAANTDSQTGLLNERALRDIFTNKELIKPNKEYIVYAAKFRNLSQILANNSALILSQVLNQLATRLQQEIRPDCILGCLNNNTFIIISPAENRACVERFKALINETQQLESFQFSLDPTEVELHYPTDVNDFESLMSSISTLIFFANQQRLPYLRYQHHLIQNSKKTSQYSAELKTAIETEQFELYLQPKFDMISGHIVGAEALIRWNHPQDGLLTPYHFLDLVEQSNMRSAFAIFVINKVFALDVALKNIGHSLPLSFNLNGYDVFDPDVITALQQASAQQPYEEHALLEIELTESETALDIKHIAAQLDHITSFGFNIALDDFGTGMSSFSYSHTLPIRTIKIDRSFIMNLDDSNASHIPIKAILFLAKNYGYQVVAEGVETQQQADILIELGCTVCQGYHYAKPMPYQDFIGLLPHSSSV